MRLPLQITYRDLLPSEAVDRCIRERAERLGQFCDRITSSRVVVESQHHRHHQGALYHVRIDLTAPGDEIIVSRDPGMHRSHEDVYVAIRDAFDAVRRRLEDYARRHRRQTKVHEAAPHGRIVRLDVKNDYGFIGTPDGREIYFHRNSIVNAEFDRLQEGDVVRFHEEAGDMGPQASTVHLEDREVA